MSQPALQVSKHNVDISLPSVTSTSSEVKSSQSIAFLWSQTPLLVAALCLVLLVAVLGLACARWLFVEGSTFIRFFGTILYVCESFVLWFGFVPNKSLVLDKYFSQTHHDLTHPILPYVQNFSFHDIASGADHVRIQRHTSQSTLSV